MHHAEFNWSPKNFEFCWSESVKASARINMQNWLTSKWVCLSFFLSVCISIMSLFARVKRKKNLNEYLSHSERFICEDKSFEMTCTFLMRIKISVLSIRWSRRIKIKGQNWISITKTIFNPNISSVFFWLF